MSPEQIRIAQLEKICATQAKQIAFLELNRDEIQARAEAFEADALAARTEGVEAAISAVHGPLWRRILAAEDCLRDVCSEQSDGACECASMIDRIEAHIRKMCLQQPVDRIDETALKPGQYLCDGCNRVAWGGDHVCNIMSRDLHTPGRDAILISNLRELATLNRDYKKARQIVATTDTPSEICPVFATALDAEQALKEGAIKFAEFADQTFAYDTLEHKNEQYRAQTARSRDVLIKALTELGITLAELRDLREKFAAQEITLLDVETARKSAEDRARHAEHYKNAFIAEQEAHDVTRDALQAMISRTPSS